MLHYKLILNGTNNEIKMNQEEIVQATHLSNFEYPNSVTTINQAVSLMRHASLKQIVTRCEIYITMGGLSWINSCYT